MENSIDLPKIRIITVSGRIGAGSTSLARHLAEKLGWKHIEGGDIFWETVRKRMHVDTKDTKLRADEEDLLFEKKQDQILKNEKHIVLESKLAGFCAQDIADIYKVGVICADENGVDQVEERVKRLMEREKVTLDDSRKEVLEREKNDLEKWRRLYAKDDQNWVYWDSKYYDLVVNTFSRSQEESMEAVLKAIGQKV